jgi:hypothetical protein
LIAKAHPSFGADEAYNLLNDSHNGGFKEPGGRLLALLDQMGIQGTFNFPYDALLGYDLWRMWAKDGIEYREEEGRLSIWGV